MKMGLSVLLALCMIASGIMLAGPAGSRELATAASALTPHAPIRIDSDADFPGIASSGNGTVWAPWVIENLEINGTGFGYCIFAGNTTEHFILRNCSLYNASGVGALPYYPDSGIVLYNVTGGTLSNITAFNSWMGIRAEDTRGTAIANCTGHSNSLAGLYLDGSDNLTLVGNNARGSEWGIGLSQSTNSTVNDNTLMNNTHGIWIGSGSSNVLDANNASNNTYGITLYWSTFDTLVDNTMFGTGIAVSGTDREQWITHTIDTSNKVNGKPVQYWKNQTGGTVPAGAGQVILANCTNVEVSGQNVSDVGAGIVLGYSHENTVSGNSANNNTDAGIVLYRSSQNNVSGNAVCSNVEHGILLTDNCMSNNITLNLAAGNRYGIEVSTTSWFNTVNDNNVSLNMHGICMYFATWNTIADNLVWMNTGNGMLFEWSHYNVAYHNNIVNNVNQAYDNTGTNYWNASYPIGGNYWSDYSGQDNLSGIAQDAPGSDGIGDTPHLILPGGAAASDVYPLIEPWANQALGESAPPSALNHSPVGIAVPEDAEIVITWNETMNWTSVEAAFSYTDGTANYTSANGTWAHDPLTNTSVFTPDWTFAYEARCNVTVNCTAADIAGNLLDQDGNGTGGEWPSDVLAWNFTVADAAPYVVSTTPANGQVDVDPNKPLKVVFSERMNQTSVEAAFSFANASYAWTVDDGVVYWNEEQTEFTFSPVEPLPTNQTFLAAIEAATAADYGGRPIGGPNHTWSFTTWKEPPAPHVVDTYPPSGAVNVNVNTYINLAFDTEMDPATTEAAFSYTDGTDVWTAADGTADWFSGNTLMSFQPNERLLFDTAYTVVLNSTATSVYGKPLDGNDNGIPDASDNFVFGFSTSLEPPVVSSFYPDDGQMEVPVSLSAIYLNFSKVMNINSVTNSVSIYPATSFTPAFSGAGMNLTMVLAADLLEGQEYRVTVLGTATDLAGIKLDGNEDGWAGDKFTFSFSTKGTEQPTMPMITNVFPPSNATVPVEPFYVSISFNVPMNKTSVENAFGFRNSTADINGTFMWNVPGTGVRFTPSGPLEYNTTYFVSLAGTAKDTTGYTLGNDTAWQYTTEAEQPSRALGDLLLYAALAFLIMLVIVLYMANRSLRRDLKKARVKLKRLRREMGIEEPKEDAAPDEPPAEEPPEKPAEPEEKK